MNATTLITPAIQPRVAAKNFTRGLKQICCQEQSVVSLMLLQLAASHSLKILLQRLGVSYHEMHHQFIDHRSVSDDFQFDF